MLSVFAQVQHFLEEAPGATAAPLKTDAAPTPQPLASIDQFPSDGVLCFLLHPVLLVSVCLSLVEEPILACGGQV